ncbi:hypothetical protein pb186bvf_020995 [Paramecium bursaria]
MVLKSNELLQDYSKYIYFEIHNNCILEKRHKSKENSQVVTFLYQLFIYFLPFLMSRIINKHIDTSY